MLEAIVTSDWHFDGLRNHYPTKHASIVANEVKRIYQYAVEHSIKYIIVPGDIADNYKISPESIRELVGVLATYDSLVTTIYMMGNHDHGDNKSTSLDIFKSMAEFNMLKSFKVISEPTVMELEGVTLNFCPFPHTELLPTNRPAINFIHRDIDGAVGDNGRKLHVKTDINLAEGSFTFGGHIHKHQFIKSKNLVLCGNIYQKNYGETGQKGFVVFKSKYKAKKTLAVKWEYIVQVPRFRLETLAINEQKDFTTLSNKSNIRYRLYIADTVVVPKNLRKDFPNIDQIWEYKGKKLEAHEDITDKLTQDIMEIPAIDPSLGLRDFLKTNGFNKDEYKQAKKLLQEALSKVSA